MPRRDGTGPQGLGPCTGRGSGSCHGNAEHRDHRRCCETGNMERGRQNHGRECEHRRCVREPEVKAD